MKKLSFSILFIFILLLSFGVVNASQQLNDTQDQLAITNDIDDDNLIQTSANDEILSDDADDKTFSDIENQISSASPGSTIYLNGSYYKYNQSGYSIRIYKNLTLDGSSSQDSSLISTLDGEGVSRAIWIYNNASVTLKNLKFINTNSGYGYAYGESIIAYSCGNLTLINCSFEDMNYNYYDDSLV